MEVKAKNCLFEERGSKKPLFFISLTIFGKKYFHFEHEKTGIACFSLLILLNRL